MYIEYDYVYVCTYIYIYIYIERERESIPTQTPAARGELLAEVWKLSGGTTCLTLLV